MSSVRTLTSPSPTVRPEKLTWFRFGTVGGKYVVTTDTGEWHALEPEYFSRFIEGSLDEDGPHYVELVRKGFIRDGFDIEFHASQLRRTKRVFFAGATQHRIHLSSAVGDLSIEQAKAIVDHIFAGQAESLTFALIQGPNRLDANVVSFIHEFAEEKNKYERRELSYELHSGLADIDDPMIDLLVDKRIQVRANFDGDAAVHDAQREMTGAAEHTVALERIRALHTAAEGKGLSRSNYSTFAEVTVSRHAIDKVSAIASGLRSAGIREFRITPPLDGENCISSSDYADFVSDLVKCLDEQDDDHERLCESQIDALLTRLRSGDVAEGLLMSTAASTGFNSRAYSPDGYVFPSCSAFRIYEEGDPMFLLGNVATSTAADIAEHSTIRSLMAASLTDCLPGYHQLWTTPYIGVDPIAAYQSTGDLFPKMLNSAHHRFSQAMVEAVFARVIDSANPQ